MDKISELLSWVRKTNPEMTRDRLIAELGKCQYSSAGLVIVWENGKKSAFDK